MLSSGQWTGMQMEESHLRAAVLEFHAGGGGESLRGGRALLEQFGFLDCVCEILGLQGNKVTGEKTN